MAYTLPQVFVFQEFTVAPVAVANPLRAHITGPHASLVRFAEEDEQADGSLGFYDPIIETSYEWPNRPAGGIIDSSYTKVFIKNALLRYFVDVIGAGSTITKTAGFGNRIRSATINFATNGSYDRDASLFDRDVQPGDIAKVRGIVDGDPVTLWTTVRDLHGDAVAAVVDVAVADDSNPASQGASSSIEQVSGPINCVEATSDETAYDGLPSGYVNETYDIVVTESSASGDYTTAKLRVISASGTDDQVDVVPAADGSPTDIGTRGLTVTLASTGSGSCSLSAEDAGIAATDLIAGQRWRVIVADAFVAAEATSGGTYTGTEDTTYIVLVTKGGVFADEPQISVSTTTGVDISGPTTVSAEATDVAVGQFGVTVSFDAVGIVGLRKGDKFYIDVVAETEGPMRTIELGHVLDDGIADDSEVDLTLFILRPSIQVEQNRTGFAPLTNWEQSATEITVSDGIIAYDASWTDGGTPLALDVISESTQEYGELFVEYRAWLSDLCDQVLTITDVGELNDQIPGPLHPDNVLKWGVFKALENANGVEVKYSAVCDPDDDESWADVLAKLVGRDDVYGLTPLTKRRTVLDLFAAHVGQMSSATEGLWRVAWFALDGVPTIPVVSAGSDVPGHLEATTSDGLVALATITDDPDTSGTQYTIVTSGLNAKFVTNDVRAGDIVRALYTGDGFGSTTYSEFVVDAVLAQNRLRLLTGPGAPINVGAKIEVWRNLSATEEAQEIALDGGSWGSRRIRAVWPDTIESSGTIQEGFHLCAALAGLSGGVLPHRGLTNIQVVGFSDANRSSRKFNRAQLDILAAAGILIVTQDLVTGAIFVRHGLTTGDQTNVNESEEMITRNVDSLSYRYKNHFAPYIGVANLVPSMITILNTELENINSTLLSENFTNTLGAQLTAVTVLEPFRRHATDATRAVVKLLLDVPHAINGIEIHLAI